MNLITPEWAKLLSYLLLINITLYVFFVLPKLNIRIAVIYSLLILALILSIEIYFILIHSLWLQLIPSAFLLIIGHLFLLFKRRQSDGQIRSVIE